MLVRAKLNATLRRFLPSGTTDNVAELELPDGATVELLVATLGIPPGHARIIVSDTEQLDLRSKLHEGQEVSLFPPLAGG